MRCNSASRRGGPDTAADIAPRKYNKTGQVRVVVATSSVPSAFEDAPDASAGPRACGYILPVVAGGWKLEL